MVVVTTSINGKEAQRCVVLAKDGLTKGFQRITGYADLPYLTQALQRPMRNEPAGLISNEFAAHKISAGLTADNPTAPHT